MEINLPEFSLIALIGGTSSGKSTFAKQHFLDTEVLSSDFFRALVSNDSMAQTCSEDAFDAMFYVASKRLKAKKLTVIDATNIQQASRTRILQLAKEHDCPAIAIVFNIKEDVIEERNRSNTLHQESDLTISRQMNDLYRSIKTIYSEGFQKVYVFNTPEEITNSVITREKPSNDLVDEKGPFDIIGDVHGCYEELELLLHKLGYIQDKRGKYYHPLGRKVVFLGDLCDRGPSSVKVFKIVMGMVKKKSALYVAGNHEAKLLRKLHGRDIPLTHGLDKTVQEIEKESPKFVKELTDFIENSPSHYVLDNEKLVVSHAGCKEELQGRSSGRVKAFCLYGETTGETDQLGLPVRLNWASNYRGSATVVYGHVPQKDVAILNNTYCIDTGCVFGGKLTSISYPEKVITSVPALYVYYEPVAPLAMKYTTQDDTLDYKDISGRLFIETELIPYIGIGEDASNAALEAMSRFAIDPHWLIYLPPTVSPCTTSTLVDYLEYPTEAVSYYKKRGIKEVVVEENIIGSRAVVICLKDSSVAKKRFGIQNEANGVIYSRTGRRFFKNKNLEDAVLKQFIQNLDKNKFWKTFDTDWVCIECKITSFSTIKEDLIKDQYLPVSESGNIALSKAQKLVEKLCSRENKTIPITSSSQGQNIKPQELLTVINNRKDNIERYSKVLESVLIDTSKLENLSIIPYHILATENKVYTSENHVWHMENLKKYVTDNELIKDCEYLVLDTDNANDIKKCIGFWNNLTEKGSEGILVKPLDFIAKRGTEVLQPSIKCRGRDYLRIIYGTEYTLPNNLLRLKIRDLHRKRYIASQEFALGIEGLNRFVKREPLYRVHQCAFSVLAFESEGVDPRL